MGFRAAQLFLVLVASGTGLSTLAKSPAPCLSGALSELKSKKRVDLPQSGGAASPPDESVFLLGLSAIREAVKNDPSIANQQLLARMVQGHLDGLGIKSLLQCEKRCRVLILSGDHPAVHGDHWIKKMAKALAKPRSGQGGYDLALDMVQVIEGGASLSADTRTLNFDWRDLGAAHAGPETVHELRHFAVARKAEAQRFLEAAKMKFSRPPSPGRKIQLALASERNAAIPFIVVESTPDHVVVRGPDSALLKLSSNEFRDGAVRAEAHAAHVVNTQSAGLYPDIIVQLGPGSELVSKRSPIRFSTQILEENYGRAHAVDEIDAHSKEAANHLAKARQLSRSESTRAQAVTELGLAQVYTEASMDFAQTDAKALSSALTQLEGAILKGLESGNHYFDTFGMDYQITLPDGTARYVNSLQIRAEMGRATTRALNKEEVRVFFEQTLGKIEKSVEANARRLYEIRELTHK
jgi:hypothetical protein